MKDELTTVGLVGVIDYGVAIWTVAFVFAEIILAVQNCAVC